MKYTVKNERETMEIGKKIAAELKGGDILCLYGELGAGKTTFVKGLASGLGIKKNITSPTFALMNVYEVKKSVKSKVHKDLKLVHIDTYRLKDAQELIDIGVEDYLGAEDTICVIEWPEKLDKLLKNKKTIDVTIEHVKNDTRIIRMR